VRQIIETHETKENGIESSENILIDREQVEKYLGKPRYSEDNFDVQKADRPGLAVGLAVQGTQGIPLIVETTAVPGKEGFTITGNMKKVMKESVKIAFSHAQKLPIERYNLSPSWFEQKHFHIHIPTGNPKDGNSAGITIATALLSLFINKTINERLIMTGELSLTGQVLAIGGLKEKIIGAKRNKAEHVIFPKQNLRDFEEIADIVKEGICFHPVECFDEVISHALP
jgi:ATP-dependent Lon protease